VWLVSSSVRPRAIDVALAICAAVPRAGWVRDARNAPLARATRLLVHEHVVVGDPHGDSNGALVTIYTEASDGCWPPWQSGYHDELDIVARVSDLLDGYDVDIVSTTVCGVYRS